MEKLDKIIDLKSHISDISIIEKNVSEEKLNDNQTKYNLLRFADIDVLVCVKNELIDGHQKQVLQAYQIDELKTDSNRDWHVYYSFRLEKILKKNKDTFVKNYKEKAVKSIKL